MQSAGERLVLLVVARRHLLNEKDMRKVTSRVAAKKNQMRAEYDFRGAVRGKFYKPLHKGYLVEIHQASGETVVRHFKLEEGAILLQPDVRKYFPDSETVNHALRSLIELMSQLPGKTKVQVRKNRPLSNKMNQVPRRHTNLAAK